MAARQNIDFQFLSDVNNLKMHFDQDKLDKILYNLLSNAFKYTPENGNVSLSLKQVANKNKKRLEISVSDTGMGVTKENLPKIFKRFYQENKSMVSEYKGTGIGLALTKELVEIHGGEIKVDSEVGKGTTFTLYIPVLDDKPAG
ncbi:MAG: ATP-binding protein, partial [Bacteroidales bacterium]|nr:ATP-binding protein [Bacteroidales bacterium]